MMNVDASKEAVSNSCQHERGLPIGLEGSDLERLEWLVTRLRIKWRQGTITPHISGIHAQGHLQ
jgi:hypothetical protein